MGELKHNILLSSCRTLKTQAYTRQDVFSRHVNPRKVANEQDQMGRHNGTSERVIRNAAYLRPKKWFGRTQTYLFGHTIILTRLHQRQTYNPCRFVVLSNKPFGSTRMALSNRTLLAGTSATRARLSQRAQAGGCRCREN